MRAALVHKIGMDFIRHHKYIILHAQGSKAFKLLARPYTSNRIMRAAEDEHLYPACLQAGFQMIQIHGIAAVFETERIGHQFSVLATYHFVEGGVDRSLNHNSITRCRKTLNGNA
ncbi:hypothetical protein D3C76_1462740 [compost metagenome]